MSNSRRDFLARASLAALSAAVISPLRPLAQASSTRTVRPPGFIDLHRPPDFVAVLTASADIRLAPQSAGQFHSDGVTVSAREVPGAIRIQLSAPSIAVKRLHLRWRGRVSDTSRVVGDAWERGYGDLEWRGLVPDRVMPWYIAVDTGTGTHAYGVRTGPRAMCYWQIDAQGISLMADVRSGGVGVELNDRVLDVCDVVARAGRAGESSFAAMHAFCRQMCGNRRLPAEPVYGSNDWYWAYGKNSAETVLADAQHIVELSPSGRNRPFAVIDDGWQPVRGTDKAGVGMWDRGNEKFPDMPGLAASVKRAGARPGIWIRPLQATATTPDSWRLPRARGFLDPTVPEAREKIAADFARLHQWGFELIKHDYTTFDLFGRWGFQMGSALTNDGWKFASGPGQTTAEVITGLYRAIRAASADALIIGCNTVSHLSAGHFEICRVGDDTSGTDWSRTRKMGVNTLAFRGPQHGAFYVADADCVGVTTAVPWPFNRQWLDLLARSGTMLFVSLAPDALGPEQKKDLTAAFALASVPHPLAEPLDWQRAVYPSRWRLMGAEKTFDWVGPDGAG
jgi:alpha-galactosidase